MSDPKTITRVVYRTYPAGDVIALLLDCAANAGRVVCYQHIGQHGEAIYWQVMGSLQHLRIMRRDGKPIRCGWDLLQRIKNESVGADVRMAEYFPPADHVVNEINARHLWEIPEDVAPLLGSL